MLYMLQFPRPAASTHSRSVSSDCSFSLFPFPVMSGSLLLGIITDVQTDVTHKQAKYINMFLTYSRAI